MGTDLIAYLRAQGGYQEIRTLDDGGVIALGRLMYTTALYVGLDRQGWTSRYCFEDEEEARKELNRMTTLNDEPQGWVAKRGA